MPPPKSNRLREAEAANHIQAAPPNPLPPIKAFKPGEVIPIKPVKCYNDFVALLLFRIDLKSDLVLEGNSAFKSEGMVIGVGPGIAAAGGRVSSQLNLGDVVAFYGNPTTMLNPQTGVYAGQRIIIIPERSVICGIDPVPFRVMSAEEVKEAA